MHTLFVAIAFLVLLGIVFGGYGYSRPGLNGAAATYPYRDFAFPGGIVGAIILLFVLHLLGFI